MNKEQKFAEKLIDFIDASHSSFHATKNVEEILIKEGFEKIELKDKWKLKKEGRYYVTKNSSAIIGFIIGKGEIEDDGFRIVGAHTDSPTFRIKPDRKSTRLNS